MITSRSPVACQGPAIWFLLRVTHMAAVRWHLVLESSCGLNSQTSSLINDADWELGAQLELLPRAPAQNLST